MAKSVAEVAEDLATDLEVAAEELDEETVEEAAVKALLPVAMRARTNAPVDEGDLRDSIRVQKFSDNPHHDVGEDFIGGAMVGPTVFYGLFVEIGAEQPPQPFLRSAFDSQKPLILDKFAAELNKAMFGD